MISCSKCCFETPSLSKIHLSILSQPAKKDNIKITNTVFACIIQTLTTHDFVAIKQGFDLMVTSCISLRHVCQCHPLSYFSLEVCKNPRLGFAKRKWKAENVAFYCNGPNNQLYEKELLTAWYFDCGIPIHLQLTA